jgi:hypothetical protein
MAQFIFEGRGKGQFNGHEQIAIHNIKHAVNWILGGYYNEYQDGNDEYLPESKAALVDDIYFSSMMNGYSNGCERFGKAPKEMRFAGEKFCRAYINWAIERDGDYKELAQYLKW